MRVRLAGPARQGRGGGGAGRPRSEERASISLGWITHGFLSLRRGSPACSSARRRTRRVAPRDAAAARDGRSRASTMRARDLAPELEPEGDERRTKRRTTTRRAPASRSHRRSRARKAGGYMLPSLDLLATPKSDRTRHAEPADAAGQLDRARRRARRLRGARRDHQCAAGAGGHALRAGAGARHQVLARDRTRRRHRPLDERALRPRRRGGRPERHRHRAAQSDPREGIICASSWPAPTTSTPAPSCRSAWARPSAASR